MPKLARIMLALNRHSVRTALTLALTVILGLMVIATIYFTLFELQWLAFLGGILFAAVLSMASQASKAEFLIIRRTVQLNRMRDQLQRESARRKVSEDAMRATEERMHRVNDLLPTPILFVDRDLRIREHNRAFNELVRLPEDYIAGQPLRDVLGPNYDNVLPHCRDTLAGKAAAYRLQWLQDNSPGRTYQMQHAPHPPDDPRPIGFYMLMLPEQPAAIPIAAEPGITAPLRTDPLAEITSDSGETLYLHSLSEQLMGGDDPQKKLARALEENNFLLFTQKILPLHSASPNHDCYEILLRLKEEEDNLLPPGGFIPVAERYGMTEDIDRWVVSRLISWAMTEQRKRTAWEIPMFCINLSAAAFVNPEFARFVRQELQHSGFPARQLCFEIDEIDTISNHKDVAHFISALKPAGCRFTVDSFGSVRLSFSNVSGLAIDFIKIDGVIIQNMFKTPADLRRLQAIIQVCTKMGVRTIAEFVEDDRTLEKLREIRVDYAQGFGIDRPVPIANVT